MKRSEYQRALEVQGAKYALEKVVRAGAARDILLKLLEHVPRNCLDEHMFDVPAWLTIRRLKKLSASLKGLQQELRLMEKTALGPSGSLTKFRFPRLKLGVLERVPDDLGAYEFYLTQLADDLRQINRDKVRMPRTMVYGTICAYVYATTRKHFWEEVAALLEAAHAVAGLRVALTGEALKKFHERHPNILLRLVRRFIDPKDSAELTKLLEGRD